MRRRWFFILLMMFVLFYPPSRMGAETIIIDTDSANLFEGIAPFFYTPEESEKISDAVGIPDDSGVFKIVKVDNITGNNPFNPYQPVFNFSGNMFFNTSDLIACAVNNVCSARTGGGGGGGGGSGCSGGAPIACFPNFDQTDVASLKTSVECMLVTNTLCKVAANGVPDLAVLFAKWWPPLSNIMVGTFSGTPYRLISTLPGPAFGPAYVISPGTYSATVENSATGARYCVNFTVEKIGASDAKLTINSLTKLQ